MEALRLFRFMGYAKAQLEKDYSPVGGRFVCADCFEDYAIKDFVEANAENNECDYCGEQSESEPIAAYIDDVIEFIIDGVKTEYEDPDNSMGYDEGWVGAVYDSDELFEELVEVSAFSDGLFEDIVGSVADSKWCKIDPYGDPLSDVWYFDWEHFSKRVKHHTRYVFYKLPKKKKDALPYSRAENPYDILDHIGRMANRLGLISTVLAVLNS